jgi:hypothetical protein
VAAVPPALNAQTTTLRRLIGSSVVVGPASMSRRHERPCWMAVSRWSGESRPPRWAARLQARVGSGSASPPPVEPTNLASALSPLPVGLARHVSAGRRAELATPGDRREGPLGPTLAGPPAAAAPCWSATPGKAPARPELVLLVAPPPTGCAAAALRCQVADSADRKTARPLPTLGGVEPVIPDLSPCRSGLSLLGGLPRPRSYQGESK